MKIQWCVNTELAVCRLSLFTRGGQLRKEIPDINEVVVKDLPGLIQYTEDGPILDGVIDVLPILAPDHDVALAKNCKLLRKRALFHFQAKTELINRDFSGT